MIKRIVIMVIGWCYVGNFCCYSFNFFYKVVVYFDKRIIGDGKFKEIN